MRNSLWMTAVGNCISPASAVAQGNVVRAMSAAYEKCRKLALRRNQTAQHTVKTGMINNVGDLNKCANFHWNWIRTSPRIHEL
jgi:hypothetical protein